jgi:glycine hydroxymethyltransferase
MLTQLPHRGFFDLGLSDIDLDVSSLLRLELERQRSSISLIAAENIISKASLEALGSIFTNKTLEGYPGRRYHGGADHVDELERIAIERACLLFGASYANVQPHSGSQANQAVLLATMPNGGRILSMSLSAGGHLSHGASVNVTSKWFKVAQYGTAADGYIDYTEVAATAHEHRPTLIIAGGSSYPRIVDFSRFRSIADDVGALLFVDMAHFAGLVASGVYPSPFPHAHIVTTTSYKSLRGARGGLILTNDRKLASNIDKAIFPGLQGTPHPNLIACKAVCLGEARRPEFRRYSSAVVDNARMLAAVLAQRGFDLVTGGTDTHMILVDLRARGITGHAAQQKLESMGLVCNKNVVPNDPAKPSVTSGLRLGTLVGTTRGFGIPEFSSIGHLIADVLDDLAHGEGADQACREHVTFKVGELTRQFPIY